MDVLTIALILVIGAVVLLVLGIVTQGERVASPELEERLERFGSQATAEHEVDDPSDTSMVAQRVGRAVQNRNVGRSMARLLSRADIRMTVGEFMITRVSAAIGGGLIGFLVGGTLTEPIIGVIIGIALGIAGWMAPHWYVSQVAGKRARQFNDQLGDTINLMANSLRAGYSLLQTMELASRETPEPMRTEFRRVVREAGLGVSPQEAMNHMLDRVPSEDLDLLVTAINIQHEVGGNLAKILDVMGETIRERVRIKGEIRVLTAQGRISAYVITALPIGLAVLLFVINPDYMGELLVWPWICLPIGGALMMIMGYLTMQKVVQIEV